MSSGEHLQCEKKTLLVLYCQKARTPYIFEKDNMSVYTKFGSSTIKIFVSYNNPDLNYLMCAA